MTDNLADSLKALSESDWYLGKDRMLLLPKALRDQIIAALRTNGESDSEERAGNAASTAPGPDHTRGSAHG